MERLSDLPERIYEVDMNQKEIYTRCQYCGHTGYIAMDKDANILVVLSKIACSLCGKHRLVKVAEE